MPIRPTKKGRKLYRETVYPLIVAKRKRRRSFRLNQLTTPMPTRFTTRLRYVETYSINPGASGLAGSYVFKANGLYDTNITGTGHQPRGYDQLMAMYDHYVVTGAKITVRMASASTETSNLITGVAIRDGTTTDTDPNDYLEGGYNKWAINCAGAQHPTKIVQKVNIGKWLGRKNVLSDPELKGTISANPTEGVFFHVWASSLELTDPAATWFVAELEFVVTFIEPKDVAQS